MKTKTKRRGKGGAEGEADETNLYSTLKSAKSNVKDDSPRIVAVDFSAEQPKLDGQQMFDTIQKIMLRNLAADGRVKNIKQAMQLKFSDYDEREKCLTIQTPCLPGARFLKWLEEIAEANDFPIKRFAFICHTDNQQQDSEAEVLVERLHRMEMKKTDWLWQNYIPLGRITILAGDPGVGKSQASIDILSRITLGEMMPDGSPGICGNCAIATAEDETSETVMPRLVAAGANLRRVRVIHKVSINGGERYLSLPRDLKVLRKMIIEEKLRLLIIDPLDAFIDQSVNTYKNQDIRSVLAPVEDMAQETRCTVLIIAHLNKKEDASVLYRVGGSIGFVGAGRSVLAMQEKKTPDADGEQMRVLYAIKANLARKPPAQQYAIESCTVNSDGGDSIPTSKIVWHGTCADPSRAGRDEGPQGRKDCLEFLIGSFGLDKEILSRDLQRAAKDCGIAWRTLAEYKNQFGITSVKRRDGFWSWREPEGGLKQFRKLRQ
jgi:hypothetical protein